MAGCLTAFWAIAAGAQQPAERWLLSYDGTYERSFHDSAPLAVAFAGPEGAKCEGGMFTGVVLLGLRAAVNGRWFASWMNPDRAADATFEDWSAYLDTLTALAGPLQRIDDAARQVGRDRVEIAVMLPAIARARVSLRGKGRELEVVTQSQREAVYGEYLDTLRKRFAARKFERLRLDAVYWLDEAVWGGGDEPSGAIAAAHARGLRVLWIPYYGAGGAERWRELGFDAAFLQPNYFFDGSLSRARLDSAVRRARTAQMGLELELDKRLKRDSTSVRRLRESLVALRASGTADFAVYDGAGALGELFTSSDPSLAELGREVARFLCLR